MAVAESKGNILNHHSDFIRSHVKSFFPPSDPDTDGDGLSDGDERNGREFKCFAEIDEDTEEEESYETSLDDADPLTASEHEDGDWIDIDGDNIPYPIERNPGKMYRDRFDDIPWIESMRRFEENFNVTDDEENKRIYNKSFNPYVEYQGKPIVEDLEVEGTYKADPDVGTGADVTIELYDPSGIDHIKLSSKQETETVDIYPHDVDEDGLIEKEIHLNTDTDDWVDKWGLDIEIVGNSGNSFEKTRSIDGAFETVTEVINNVADYVGEFGEWVWNKVTTAASTTADAAAELANSLVDHVKDEIVGRFTDLLDPIVSGLENYIGELGSTVQQAVDDETTPEDVREVMLGPLSGLTSVFDVIQEVTNKLKPLMDAIGSAADMIIDTAVDTMASVFGGNSDDVDNDFIQLIKDSDDVSAGDLIKEYFGFEESESASSNDLSVSNSNSDPTDVVLSILNLWPSINLAAYFAGTGKAGSAARDVLLSSIGFLSSALSSTQPVALSTMGMAAGVGSFIDLLVEYQKSGLILGNPTADAILIGWNGMVAGYSAYIATEVYQTNGVI